VAERVRWQLEAWAQRNPPPRGPSPPPSTPQKQTAVSLLSKHTAVRLYNRAAAAAAPCSV